MKLSRSENCRPFVFCFQDFLLPSLLIRDARTGHFLKFNLSDEKSVRYRKQMYYWRLCGQLWTLPRISVQEMRTKISVQKKVLLSHFFRSYAIYTNVIFTALMKLCVIVLLSLVFFEEPAMPKFACPLWVCTFTFLSAKHN